MKKLFYSILICILIISPLNITLAESLLSGFISNDFETSGQTAPDENVYIEQIQHPQLLQTVDGVTFALEEALYDGRTLFAVFTPRSDSPILSQFSDAAEVGGKRVSISCLDSDAVYGSRAEKLNDGSSLTLYFSQTFLHRQEARDFTLRFLVRSDGSDELFGENATLTLASQMEWTEQLLSGNASLGGALVNICAASCPLESCIEVSLQLPDEMTEEQTAVFSESIVKIIDASSGEELPLLNAVSNLLDGQGNACGEPFPGGSIVALFSLPVDFSIPDSLQLELKRIFSDSSIADSCTIP